MTVHRSFLRTRWATLGAVAALVLGGGTARVANAADPGVTQPPKSAFVPIEPCRLFDTRPGAENVGSRTTPLGPGDTFTQQVTGSNGKCLALPANASGVALNVTTLAGTADSYLTVYPADAARPLASNLNWTASAPPNPNKVDVKLSATGEVALYNFAGSVHVLADVVGYYVGITATTAFLASTTVNVLNTTPTAIQSGAIVVPASGVIVATGAVTAVSSSGDGIACNLSTTATYDPNRVMAWDGSTSGSTESGTVAPIAHFFVDRGTHQVSVMCRAITAAATYARPQLSLVFLPS